MTETALLPTFTVSPWEMVKSFPLRSKLRFVWSAIRIAYDPDRTEELFALSQLFMRHEVRGKSGLRDYVHSLFEAPGIRKLYEEGYMPPPADLAALTALPEGTLGRAFEAHMRTNGLSVDFYPPVAVTDEVTWLEMRGRQTHDILHVVTGFPISLEGELGLQAFAAAQFNSPLSAGIIGGGLVHASLFKPWILQACLAEVQKGFEMGRRAGTILAYRFEDNWGRPLAQVRADLGIIC